MSDALTFVFDEIKDRLSEIEEVEDRVWVGGVHRPVPTDLRGDVLPYIAIFPGVRAPVDDVPVADVITLDARMIRFQVTVAGKDEEVVFPIVGKIDDLLTGYRIGQGQVKLQEGFPSAGLMYDDGVKPGRAFEATFWEITL